MSDRNRTLLATHLESLAIFDNRYKDLKWINPVVAGVKRGHFSLVFSAFDTLNNNPVVIKFFDPAFMASTYRLEAFRREPEILKKLTNQKRCLQMISPLKEYPFVVAGFTINFPYFVVEWLENDVDGFFLEQDKISTLAKLEFFQRLVLAVEALHKQEVFHRDIKKDNFRATDCSEKIVKTIDMGTAAGHEVPQLLNEYANPVGYLPYSAPETFCGLTGDRRIGKFTDFYALGCLLFELFNSEPFDMAHHQKAEFTDCRYAATIYLNQFSTLDQKITAWKECCSLLAHKINYPDIEEGYSSAPPAIGMLLNRLVQDLTLFDFNKRLVDFQKIRQRVTIMTNLVQNTARVKKETELRKQWRARRIENIEMREQRLLLAKQKAIGNLNAK